PSAAWRAVTTTSSAERPGSIATSRPDPAYPTRRRSSRASIRPIVLPRTSTAPVVGQRYVLATWTSVVLPEPFGPTTTHRSPSPTAQSIGPRIVRPERRTDTPVSRRITRGCYRCRRCRRCRGLSRRLPELVPAVVDAAGGGATFQRPGLGDVRGAGIVGRGGDESDGRARPQL